MMIEGSKQQQLTFDKGITNVPSDAICSDNALAESVGMVYDDGEHKVIQRPVKQMEYSVGYTNYRILYIHNFVNTKRYIARKKSGHYTTEYSLVWCINNNGVLTESAQDPNPFANVDVSNADNIKVNSIGKYLIIDDGTKKSTFLWIGDTYTEKDNIPDLDFQCYIWSLMIPSGISNSAKIDDMIDGSGATRNIKIDAQEKFNDAMVGLYFKNLKAIANNCSFAEPFFVRLALELYGGTYFYISQPVLMFPSVTKNSYVKLSSDNRRATMITTCSDLFISQNTDYSAFSDIVKDVVVFVTDQVHLYDTMVDQPLTNIPFSATPGDANVVSDHIQQDALTYYSRYYVSHMSDQGTTTNDYYRCLKEKEHDNIAQEIMGKSVFYRLCSLGIRPVVANIREKIEPHILENITTQTFLQEDDYFTRSTLISEYMYSYNSRLNLANIQRGFFNGFSFFMPFDHADAGTPPTPTKYTYDFYVTIETDTGDRRVKVSKETNQKQGIYFFYPDSRAKHVLIYRGNVCVCSQDLKEHPSLNGAYFLRGLPGADISDEVTTDTPTSTTLITTPEILPNYILQSEVNNPYVFKAAGYFKVGTGKIIAMSTTTQALSEGQYGGFPLIVFTDTGLWALSVASTGYYDTIKPRTRDVCTNTNSIVQTDGAVFFVSKKGLMMVYGDSTNRLQVRCVSEQMSGKSKTNEILTDEISFNEFLQNAFMAYDYRDSLLWIFNTNIITVAQQPYIYSIKSGTFGRVTSDLYDSWTITNTVNDYPDYLLSAGNHFYSLLDRPDINADGTIVDNEFVYNTYSASMFTRPMKLENALALKSIMQVKHIHDMNENATLTLRIFASNNLNNWVELHSLGGMPWKYYRFRYDFSNLKATDRFAGTMLITHERRTNKLR